MIEGDILMYDKNEKLDLTAIGQAVKNARENQHLTREKVAEMLELAPRYLMSIENTGQHPSLQKFYEIVKMFDISVDEFFFPETSENKTSCRRQLDKILDGMDDNDLTVVIATAKAVQKYKETGK